MTDTRIFSVARLIEDAQAFFGVEQYIVAGALALSPDPTTVDDARALIESWTGDVSSDPTAAPTPGFLLSYAFGKAIAFALAGDPDLLVTGVITRDANGTVVSAGVTWPDSTPGNYTATVVSTTFPGAVDSYTITYGSPVQATYTQPAVTRDSSSGAVTNRPLIVVS